MPSEKTNWHVARAVVGPLAALAVFALALTLALRETALLEPIELTAHDWGVRTHAGRTVRDDRIVIVGINDADLAETGYPITDGTLAALLDRVLAAKPLAVGVDILRDRPIVPGADTLRDLLQQNQNVLWAETLGLGEFRGVEPPEVLRGTDRTGLVDQMIDPGDRTVRRGLLFAGRDGVNKPTFPLQLAVRYLVHNQIRIGPSELQPAYLQFGGATVVPFERNDGGYAGADAAGYQYLMSYRAGPAPFAVHSFADVMSGATAADALMGKLVLVGYISEGLKDFFFTPFTPAGDQDFRTFGVLIHALQVQQLLDFGEGISAPVTTVPEWLEILFVGIFAGFGVLVAGVARKYWLIIGIYLAAGGAILLGFQIAIGAGVWVPPAAPLVALTLASGMGILFMYNAEAKQRRQQELARVAAEAATEAKSAFLATVSHEIRTPMNGVIGMLELMRSFKLEGELRQLVGVAHNSAEGLLAILNDILDSSKIEAGKLTIEAIPFALPDVVDGVGALLASRANEKGLELTSVVDPALPLTVIGDPTRLRQVITNLASNAVKFTESGSVRIRALSIDTPDTPNWVRFEVIDTGIGLTEEQQGRLFQPFAQADESTTRKFGGTGLGLSICRSLVEMMGGRIGVSSVAGAGSTFFAEIPLPPEVGAGSVAREADLDGLGVVIVTGSSAGPEDMPLQLHPAACHVVADGATLANVIAAARTDASPMVPIIVDLEPGAAFDLHSQLREAGLANASQFLLLAPQDDISARGAARERGFTAALPKPARTPQLRQFVASAAGRASSLGQDDETLSDVEAAPVFQHAGKMLVIDDVQTNRLVAQRQFRQIGITTDVADGARTAWDLTKATRYDIIFVDLSMPEIDGFGFTKTFREWERAEGRPDTPVISMSGFALEPDDPKIVDAGISGVLPKPATLHQIATVIRQWLPNILIADAQAGPASNAEPADSADGDASNAETPIDLSIMQAELGEDAGELIDEFLGMFVAEMRDNLMPQFVAAVAAEDRGALQSTAHAAKGAAENVGAVRLGPILKSLEADAPEADWEALRAKVNDAEMETKAAIAFVEARDVV